VERLVTSKVIEVLYPATYRVVGSVPTTRQRALAACLWLAPNALVSHQTAAMLLRLDGIRTDALHVTVPPSTRRGRGDNDVTLHRAAVSRTYWRLVDRIPCTSATRTLLDIAPGVDDEALETAFESARRIGLVTTTTAMRALETGGRRPGAGAMRRVLLAAEQRPLEYRLEVKLGRLLRKAALPPSVAQFPIGRYRLDRAWPDRRYAVEADGFQHHGTRLAWKRDRRRIADIEAMGWRITIVTWDDVTKRPDQTLDRIRDALNTMGG
jgi:very-short-patch-repair endonuclease